MAQSFGLGCQGLRFRARVLLSVRGLTGLYTFPCVDIDVFLRVGSGVWGG